MWYGLRMPARNERRDQHNGTARWPMPPPSAAPMPSFRCVVVDDDGYPHSDGVPMAENTWQFNVIHHSAGALKVRYQGDPNKFVAADMLMYYEKGNRKAAVAPDVFVAFGVANEPRLSYKLWEEGVVPCFALEVLSGSSAVRDTEFKRMLYARLGIEEFWLYDPLGAVIGERLLGLRLRAGVYEAIPPLAGRSGFLSAALNLEFRDESGSLRMHDPVTGKDLKGLGEALEAERQAEARATKAEARVAELEALLRRQQGQQG